MQKKADANVALVTGGSQGIGRAISEAFAKQGYSVVIFSRTQGEVQKAAAEIASYGLKCEGAALDVSDFRSVELAFASAAKKYGRIDVLVTCAGVYGPIGPLEENDPAQWEQAIRINLCGTVHSVRAALPYMKRQGSGCIVTLAGGGVGGNGIKQNFSSYVTGKFGVCGFTEALSRELEGTGVRINAISPGAVNTRLLDQVLKAGDRAGKEFLAASKKQKETGGTPLGAAASLALFLASKAAAGISGRTLSAVWDKKERLSAIDWKSDKSIFTLRRIDGELFGQKRK